MRLKKKTKKKNETRKHSARTANLLIPRMAHPFRPTILITIIIITVGHRVDVVAGGEGRMGWKWKGIKYLENNLVLSSGVRRCMCRFPNRMCHAPSIRANTDKPVGQRCCNLHLAIPLCLRTQIPIDSKVNPLCSQTK